MHATRSRQAVIPTSGVRCLLRPDGVGVDGGGGGGLGVSESFLDHVERDAGGDPEAVVQAFGRGMHVVEAGCLHDRVDGAPSSHPAPRRPPHEVALTTLSLQFADAMHHVQGFGQDRGDRHGAVDAVAPLLG